MEGRLPACQLTYEAHIVRKRRKVRQRNASAKALAKPVYRRDKPNKKRAKLFQGFSSGELYKLLGCDE